MLNHYLLVVLVFIFIGYSNCQCNVNNLPSNQCTISSSDLEYFTGQNNVNAGENVISIQSTLPPSSNHIMVIQMQGVDIHEPNTNNYGANDGSGTGFIFNPTTDSIGKYEFNIISSVSSIPGGYDITFENNFENNYNTGFQYKYQIISFPFCETTILDSHA